MDENALMFDANEFELILSHSIGNDDFNFVKWYRDWMRMQRENVTSWWVHPQREIERVCVVQFLAAC